MTSIWQKVKQNFIAGVVVIVPLIISVWAIRLLVTAVSALANIFRPPLEGAKGIRAAIARHLFENFGDLSVLASWSTGLVILIFVLVVIGILGFVARTYLGRRLVTFGEWVIEQIPVIRTIYVGVKQLLSSLLGSGEQFKNAALIEYPRRGVWVIAFVTGTHSKALDATGEDSMVSVFVPTTPNPTSGFMLLLPEEDIHRLDVPVEDAIKMLMSGGIISLEGAGEGPEAKEKLLQRLAKRSKKPDAQKRPGGGERGEKPQG